MTATAWSGAGVVVLTTALAAALVAGCDASPSAERPTTTEAARVLELRDACPGVHVAYDRLVAADQASAQAFEESVRRLWQAGVAETRAGLAPVLEHARTLARADRVAFPAARDGLYSAIARLSATCASLGSPILH